METTELLKKVRKIEIKTRGLTNQVFSGEYHSAFKGRGMAFSEVREYIPGDDIRNIDWNVTARFNHPYVKVFEEERELTVMLLVDISASENFGTAVQFKRSLITELCAVLAFSAIENNDKIGVIFFTDRIEKFIPPKKGRSHILRIIRELIELEPDHKQTNIGEALRFLTNAIKKRSIAFIISDFKDNHAHFSDALKVASRKHDMAAFHVFDQREAALPDVGLVRFMDAETGNEKWIDTSDHLLRKYYSQQWQRQMSNLEELLSRSGVDFVHLSTGKTWVQPLMTFFKKRGKK